MLCPSYSDIHTDLSQMMQSSVILSDSYRQSGVTNRKSKQDTDNFLTTPGYLPEYGYGKWQAEHFFDSGLSIWCICFVRLSAFNGVKVSISYISLILASEAVEFSGFANAKYLVKASW